MSRVYAPVLGNRSQEFVIAGFTPASRAALFKKIKPLEIKTAAKMVECRWLKPQLAGQFEFVEWTLDGYLSGTASVWGCARKIEAKGRADRIV